MTRISMILILVILAPAVAAQSEPAEETLIERLGGISGIALVVDDFVDDFVADPVIMANPDTRERKPGEGVPGLKYHLTSIICEASGGPCTYVGPTLRQAHEGLNVSETEWERMGELFAATLARHNVGEREQQELFAILGPTKDDIVMASE
ncbi:group 1 truncated hemoglobin [Thioalkalivibrio sp.]|uniref:group I truncated hemoglobin n=1 Tax=Thioalkalivibrio sp. TaxID=2093813 RepID=UPI0012D6B71E|nr:group 1 truncated hemoglobin [Thioalkalivibrio sp.]TVP77660.1 MAG: group 1 truncated hemoglobin [Thioalkalivibrio sp.]